MLQLKNVCNILCKYFSVRYFLVRRFYGPLAHLVEHLTLNQGVRGSSPRRPTAGGLRTLLIKVFGLFLLHFSFQRFLRFLCFQIVFLTPIYKYDILIKEDVILR